MEAAFAELPLTFFTTFVLIGAGSFILQAFVAAVAPAPQETAKKLDVASFVPLVITAAGFAAAFAHLASPLNAPFALTGIGRSPMSNEIAVGSAFLVAALIYCVLASMGRLSPLARKAFSIVLGIGGLLCAAFTGAAYLMPTIISWDTPLALAETVGFALFAGGILSAATLSLLGKGEVLYAGKMRLVAVAVIVCGAVVGCGALAAHTVMVGGFETAGVSGAALVQGAQGCLALAIGCATVAAASACYALLHKASRWVLPTACACALVAVFAARLVFYAMQMSVAL